MVNERLMSARRLARWAMLLLTVVSVQVVSAGEVIVGSWNVKRLGEGTRDLVATARVASQFDLLALQEVMDAQALDQLRQQLDATTGFTWQTLASHAIGRGRYKEMYAFLYRTDRVQYVDGAVVYLDTGDRFAREPFAARFRDQADGGTFVVATVHVLYGKGVEDREPEIRELRAYWDWLTETFPDNPIRLLVGDFNLEPAHGAWGALRAQASPLIDAGETTLSTREGRYANLYDNIWVPRDQGFVTKQGIYPFPAHLGLSHRAARQLVSDHAPVWAVVNVPGE